MMVRSISIVCLLVVSLFFPTVFASEEETKPPTFGLKSGGNHFCALLFDSTRSEFDPTRTPLYRLSDVGRAPLMDNFVAIGGEGGEAPESALQPTLEDVRGAMRATRARAAVLAKIRAVQTKASEIRTDAELDEPAMDLLTALHRLELGFWLNAGETTKVITLSQPYWVEIRNAADAIEMASRMLFIVKARLVRIEAKMKEDGLKPLPWSGTEAELKELLESRKRTMTPAGLKSTPMFSDNIVLERETWLRLQADLEETIVENFSTVAKDSFKFVESVELLVNTAATGDAPHDGRADFRLNRSLNLDKAKSKNELAKAAERVLYALGRGHSEQVLRDGLPGRADLDRHKKYIISRYLRGRAYDPEMIAKVQSLQSSEALHILDAILLRDSLLDIIRFSDKLALERANVEVSEDIRYRNLVGRFAPAIVETVDPWVKRVASVSPRMHFMNHLWEDVTLRAQLRQSLVQLASVLLSKGKSPEARLELLLEAVAGPRGDHSLMILRRIPYFYNLWSDLLKATRDEQGNVIGKYKAIAKRMETVEANLAKDVEDTAAMSIAEGRVIRSKYPDISLFAGTPPAQRRATKIWGVLMTGSLLYGTLLHGPTFRAYDNFVYRHQAAWNNMLDAHPDSGWYNLVRVLTDDHVAKVVAREEPRARARAEQFDARQKARAREAAEAAAKQAAEEKAPKPNESPAPPSTDVPAVPAGTPPQR